MGESYVTYDEHVGYKSANSIVVGAMFLVTVLCLLSSCTLWVTERAMHSCAEHGHGYEARHSIKPPTKEIIETVSKQKQYSGYPSLLTNVLKNQETKIYVCDVCTYCGDIVPNQDTERTK